MDSNANHPPHDFLCQRRNLNTRTAEGDLPQALGAYNAGPETVDKAGGVPDIAETKAYIEAIVDKVGLKRIELPSIPMPKPIGN